MRWLQFILSHSIFIALCAASLCYQSLQLLRLPVNSPVYALVFFSTLASYNFYWLISKWQLGTARHLSRYMKDQASNLVVFLLASVATVYALYQSPALVPLTGIAVLLTLLYSAPLWPVKAFRELRKAGFLKTVLLAFTWTFVTILLPIQAAATEVPPGTSLLFVARFFFMLMLCLIFDARDVKVDQLNALRSLATDVSPRMLRLIIASAFLLYLCAGLLLRVHLNDHRQLAAMVVTGLVTLLVYRMSLQQRGYFFYYFGVDGLMLFSALATYVATI